METLIAAPQAWLSAHADVSREYLVAAALQLLVIGLAYLLARALRDLAQVRTDRLVDRLDPRLRNPRLVAAFRPLALPILWWAFVVLVNQIGHALGYGGSLLHIASSLLFAWIAIRATTALVRDPALSHAIAIIVWLVVAIDILGLLDATTTALDNLALTLGNLRLSLLTLMKAVLLLGLLLWAASAISRIIRLRISTVTSLTPSVQVLVANLLKITLMVLAVIIALNTVGIDLTALALFSGAVGVGIGLGLQKVVANFVSGIVLLLDRSIKPGDVVEIEHSFGWVTSMGARYVSVCSRDGKEYLIPNEDLITHRVVNWTYSSRLVRLDVPFGVGYGADLRKVRELAVTAATSAERTRKTPPPACHVTAFRDGTIDLVLRFWIEDPNNGVTNIKGEVLMALYESLTENRVELPLPQYEVRLQGGAEAEPIAQPTKTMRARHAS